MKKKKKQPKYYFFKKYLDDGERIVDIAHRHILVYKVNAAKSGFFGVMLPSVLYIIFREGGLFFLAWIALGVVGLLYHFMDWYFDVWLLTNYGVIDIEQNGFFNMTSTRIEYHMIEGISYTIKGFWRTVFNFGDITIDKLGAKTSVMLLDAANPKEVERKVMDFQERFVAEKSIRDHQALKSMLADMISYHAHNGKVTLPDILNE